MEEVPAAAAEIADGAKRTAVPADGRPSVSVALGSAATPPGSPIALRGLAVRPVAPPSPHERPVPGGHLHTLRRMAGATVEPSPRSQHASAQQVPADTADGGGPSADARVRASAKAYSAPLAETPELFRLWCRASKDGKNTYRTSRRNFWNLVNNDTGSDAEWARQMFADAQVEVQVGTAKAPMLRMRTGDRNAGREGTDRRITLDHIDPQSENATRASDAANLHFDTQRDNSFRGAKPLQATASVRPPATETNETPSGTATNLPPPTATVKSTDSPPVDKESTALGEGESPRKLVEAPDVQDGIGSGPVAVAAGTPGYEPELADAGLGALELIKLLWEIVSPWIPTAAERQLRNAMPDIQAGLHTAPRNSGVLLIYRYWTGQSPATGESIEQFRDWQWEYGPDARTAYTWHRPPGPRLEAIKDFMRPAESYMWFDGHKWTTFRPPD